MFLFDLTYRAPLSQVDALLPGHIAYLERHYRSGEFLCSGRKTPRTGGVILCRASSLAEARAILEEDRPEELFAHPKSERLKTFLAKVL